MSFLGSLGKKMSRLLSLIITQAPRSLHLSGPFSSYDEAFSNSSGYDHPVILDKVSQAVIGVLNGDGVYERDGTLFASCPPDLVIRQILQQRLFPGCFVADYGGGLGGMFINHSDLFDSTHRCVVIEQPIFAEAGLQLAADYNLNIGYSNSIWDLDMSPDIFILSSVLQYIPNAMSVLRDVASLKPATIIVDRTAFVDNRKMQWWLQIESDYYGMPISYPVSPLRESMILEALRNYSLIDRWINPFDPQRPAHRGLLLQRNS